MTVRQLKTCIDKKITQRQRVQKHFATLLGFLSQMYCATVYVPRWPYTRAPSLMEEFLHEGYGRHNYISRAFAEADRVKMVILVDQDDDTRVSVAINFYGPGRGKYIHCVVFSYDIVDGEMGAGFCGGESICR